MAHMKLKQIPKRKKVKYFLLIIVLYLMFAYTFYNSFKNTQKIMNQEFINYIITNGNANLKNDYNILTYAIEDTKEFLETKEYLDNEYYNNLINNFNITD